MTFSNTHFTENFHSQYQSQYQSFDWISVKQMTEDAAIHSVKLTSKSKYQNFRCPLTRDVHKFDLICAYKQFGRISNLGSRKISDFGLRY